MFNQNLPGFKACLLAGVIAGVSGCSGDKDSFQVSAGQDVSVNEGNTVQLQGSSNAQRSTFYWEQTAGPTVSLTNTTSSLLSFSAPEVDADTQLTFRLTAETYFEEESDTVVVTVKNVPLIATANAGSDFSVVENTSDVTLSGSGSASNTDRQVNYTYAWRQLSGPAVALSSETIANPTFTAPEVDADTQLVFGLRVSTEEGESTEDTVIVRINAATTSVTPVLTADAGADFSVAEKSPNVKLTAAFSFQNADNANTDVSYQWRQVSGPAVSLSDVTIASPTFTAPEVSADTPLIFGVIASNGELTSTEDVITVTVTNVAPIAKAGSTLELVEGEIFKLDGSNSTPNGDSPITTYTWRAIENSIAIPDGDAASPIRDGLIAPRVDGDSVEYKFGLVVGDGKDLSAEDILIVRVSDGGEIPVARASNVEGQQNTTMVIDADASSDSLDRALTYNWSQVLATGETPLTLTQEGSKLTFTAPAVDSDTTLTFTLTVDNGLNTSEPITVSALIKSKEVYSGKVVNLKGNPFTTLYDSLDLSAYGELYDMVVEGSNAYITYYNGNVDETPAGLLIVDVSDEKELKVVSDFPITFYGGKNAVGVQLNLALDVAAGYAYIVDNNIVDGEDFTSLVRVNLNAAPADGTHAELYANVEIDSNKIGRVSDLVLRNGSLYLTTVGERAILKLDLASAPAAPTITKVWEDNPASPLDISSKDPSRSRSKYQGTEYERLEMANDGTGTVAVLFNGNYMQVVRLDNTDSVTAFYSVRSSGTEIDSNTELDFRIFNGVMSDHSNPAMSMAFDDTGNYMYVSFPEDTEANRPLRPFSALEKIDIRTPGATPLDTAGVYFQTTEDAYEVVRSGGVTYLASGIQGIQLLEDIDNDGEPSIALKTYYQTPKRAEDIVIANNAANLPRAYVIGDSTFTVVDLDPEQQSAPAKATNWVSEYVDGTVVNPDKNASGHATNGNKRGQASDVEIVPFYNEEGVLINEFAVVVESADPDRDSEANSENKLVIFNVDSETFDGVEVPLADVDTGFGLKENYADIRLHQAYGNVYLYDPVGNPGTALRISHEQIASATPVLSSLDFSFNVSAFAFTSPTDTIVSGDNNIAFWQVNDAGDNASEMDRDDIWNNSFYSNMQLNETGTHLYGSGEFDSGRGCAVFGLVRYDGSPSKGSTAPKFVYQLNKYERFENEFESAYFYSGTTDPENEICYGGYGFNQNSSYRELDADDEITGETPHTAFGIQVVDFKVPLSSIVETDGQNNDDPWTDGSPDDFANVYLYDLPDNPEDITRVGHRLYVANNTFGGIQIIDATYPNHLALEGVIHTEDKAKGVAVNHDETLAIIADDNIRGIVRAPLYYPSLDRIDNDAITKALDADNNPVMTPEEVANADAHAKAGETLRYQVLNVQAEDSVICYASEDTKPYGDETCTVEIVEGNYFVSWTLSANVIDQQIRVAVGDNIQFLSTAASVFVE